MKEIDKGNKIGMVLDVAKKLVGIDIIPTPTEEIPSTIEKILNKMLAKTDTVANVEGNGLTEGIKINFKKTKKSNIKIKRNHGKGKRNNK